MEFIDAHHHLWDLHTLDYVWLNKIGQPKPFGDPTDIQRNYRIEDYLVDVQTLENYDLIGSVHIQADAELSNPTSETQWIQSIIDAAGFPTAIVGFVNLLDKYAEQTIEQHMTHRCFRGVRQIIGYLEERPDLSFINQNLLNNPIWREQYELLGAAGLSFDLQLYPEQMIKSAEFLAHHTTIPVVIDHAGSPYDQTNAGLLLWQNGIRILAELPHLMIKLSGLGMYDTNWSADRQQFIFDEILDAFGSSRVMIGSNFPVDRLMRTYAYVFNQYQSWCKSMPHQDWQKIFSKNAQQFYRLAVESTHVVIDNVDIVKDASRNVYQTKQ